MSTSTGKQKLVKDLVILEAMAAGMETYLMRKELFWQTAELGLPKLTLGGYLMRQHRLLALRDTLLDETERARLDKMASQFDAILTRRRTFFVQKAHQSLKSRLRQWDHYLQELEQDGLDGAAYYGSAVETRAMIAATIDKLQTASFRLEASIPKQLHSLDQFLGQHWQAGPFVWPAEWQSAYPPDSYWWLYGRPI